MGAEQPFGKRFACPEPMEKIAGKGVAQSFQFGLDVLFLDAVELE